MKIVVRRLLVAVGVGLAGMTLLAGPAGAQTGCAATADGTDVLTYGTPGDALEVDATDQVTITATSAGAAFRHYDVQLEFAGMGWSVASGSVREASWSDVVKIDEFASKGVGIYKVVATSTLDDGGTCAATAYVNVSGASPLSTTAGRAATGVAALGLIGTAAAGLRAARAATGAGQVLFAEDSGSSGPSDESERQRWLQDARIEQAASERDGRSRTNEGGMGAWTFCLPLAVTAFGFTLRAVLSETASSVVAAIGRIHR